MSNFDARDWYWFVGGDTSKAWSSARASWVDAADPTFAAWRAEGRGATPIGALGELEGVLREFFPAGMLTVYVAAKRFEVETGGILFNGATIATDRESQAMISGAYSFVAANPEASISYKTAGGFVQLNAAQVQAVANAVGQHVQACFAKEAVIATQIAGGGITSIAEIDAAFAELEHGN